MMAGGAVGSLGSEIDKIEDLAQCILSKKRESRPKRPLIIEFCGSPKSGKTAAINSLVTFLKRNNFRVVVLSERASVCPVTNKTDPLFNTWTGCAVVASLIPYITEQKMDVDIIIADRGIFDALCWFTWLCDEGYLSASERSVLSRFFTLNRLRDSIDLTICLTSSPEISLEREHANLMTKKMGSIMNINVLSAYLKAIEKTIREYGSLFSRVVRLDTSEMPQNEVAVLITNEVLKSLEGLLVERIAFLKKSSLGRVPEDLMFPVSELSRSESRVHFDSRDIVEGDSGLLQIVPIVAITDLKQEKIFVFKKRRESLGSDTSPEFGKVLLYAGGHARYEDREGVDEIELLNLARVALRREMKEELGHCLPLDSGDIRCIWDREGNPSSANHLALVWHVCVDPKQVRLNTDAYEHVPQGRGVLSGRFVGFSEIDDRSMDSWSAAIYSWIFNRELSRLF